MTTTTTNTTTTGAALLREEGLELDTCTTAEWAAWQTEARERGLRCWFATGRLGQTRLVLTEGGTKTEAKRQARRAAMASMSSGSGSCNEAPAGMRPAGLRSMATECALRA